LKKGYIVSCIKLKGLYYVSVSNLNGGSRLYGEKILTRTCPYSVVLLLLMCSVTSFNVEADITERFNSSVLDPTIWTSTNSYNVSSSIDSGELIIQGLRDGGGDWANSDTWTNIETVARFGPGVEIEYRNSIGGYGTGYGSGFSLYQDANNHIDMGQTYDPGAGANVTLSRGGKLDGAWLGGVRLDLRPIDSSIMHTFKIVYAHDKTAEIFVDGNLVDTYSFDLDNFNIRFFGHTRRSGDQIRAVFDDVSIRELAPPTEDDLDCPSDFWFYVLLAVVIGEFLVIIALLAGRRNKDHTL
jgi:hypothetical protein